MKVYKVYNTKTHKFLNRNKKESNPGSLWSTANNLRSAFKVGSLDHINKSTHHVVMEFDLSEADQILSIKEFLNNGI